MKRREVRERDEAAERERLEARTEGLLAQLKANEAARKAPAVPATAAEEPEAPKPAAEEPPGPSESPTMEEPAVEVEPVEDDSA